jgi:hypothetical protein
MHIWLASLLRCIMPSSNVLPVRGLCATIQCHPSHKYSFALAVLEIVLAPLFTRTKEKEEKLCVSS